MKEYILRVFLVDDHQLFRSGLRLLLSNLQKGILFEEACHCDGVLNFENKDDIDLILLDLYIPGTTGFEALNKIKEHYHCSVVVLSSEDNPRIIRDSIAQGAAGFIPKSSSPEVLIAALQLVLANGVYLPPHVLSDKSESSDSGESGRFRDTILNQLSKRQLDVLTKASQGKSNKIIARELHIAEGTVKAHLSACYRVLEVDNRTEAVYATVSMGLLSDTYRAGV